MKTKSTPLESNDEVVHGRILNAAFALFAKRGYSETTMLEIANRARVSKRELYALVGNKTEMLVACIEGRAQRLGMPSSSLQRPRNRTTLARTLVAFGVQFLREVSAPAVIAVFRLAIAEAERAPEVARALDRIGREASRSALTDLLEQARSSDLIEGDPSTVAEQFTALLWGELLLSLLLRVAQPPNAREMNRRARAAAIAVLRLHSRSPQGP